MHIYFGLEFDDLVYANFYESGVSEGNIHYIGPRRLLELMETLMGLGVPPDDNQYLRIEKARQSLSQMVENQTQPLFFAHSFAADQLATAARLLEMRDELLLAGWSFQPQPDLPPRLLALSQFHELVTRKIPLGFADRFDAVLQRLETFEQTPISFYINEPFYLLTPHFQNFFSKCQEKGHQVKHIETATDFFQLDTDLARFQRTLLEANINTKKQSAKGDGSLLLVKAKRETDSAAFLAICLRENPNFRPLCLVPEKKPTLNNALMEEGLPSMGGFSTSMARPSLQLLKLATAFFWHPIDPFRMMEFVSLPNKPLDKGLGDVIASELAKAPGLNSERWHIALNTYLDQMAALGRNVQDIRAQYSFWFERKRYANNTQVPVNEVFEVFKYLEKWSSKNKDKNNSLQSNAMTALGEQSRRICEILEALPETERGLTMLGLERLVRAVSETVTLPFADAEVGHLPCIHNTSALLDATDYLLWWNFVERESKHFFSKWYKHELDYLTKLSISLPTPKQESDLLVWRSKLPILRTRQTLVLIMPQTIDGQMAMPHALYGNLRACFTDLSALTFDIDTQQGWQTFSRYFSMPPKEAVEPRPLPQAQPFVCVPQMTDIVAARKTETLTSLENLFYYPYQWAFKYVLKLNKSPILTVAKDKQLFGNLSHRLIEMLLKENDLHNFDKTTVNAWVERRLQRLLEREGAVLLLYGREPEKAAFANRMKAAAWNLVRILQNNRWEVEGTEIDLIGMFEDIELKAKADLILRRAAGELAVVDLKWSGAARRSALIKNEEDLQLVMYANLLLLDKKNLPHTAFYILEERGKMIARNYLAFKEASIVGSQVDYNVIHERIMEKMKQTYTWRKRQLAEGKIEVRTQQTAPFLDETYGELLWEVLEMKRDDAPFDEYQALIGRVR